jgi:hypothetical protein
LLRSALRCVLRRSANELCCTLRTPHTPHTPHTRTHTHTHTHTKSHILTHAHHTHTHACMYTYAHAYVHAVAANNCAGLTLKCMGMLERVFSLTRRFSRRTMLAPDSPFDTTRAFPCHSSPPVSLDDLQLIQLEQFLYCPIDYFAASIFSVLDILQLTSATVPLSIDLIPQVDITYFREYLSPRMVPMFVRWR